MPYNDANAYALPNSGAAKDALVVTVGTTEASLNSGGCTSLLTDISADANIGANNIYPGFSLGASLTVGMKIGTGGCTIA